MTMQTAYEAQDFLFSSKEEAEMFEETFDLSRISDYDFSCYLMLPKKIVMNASLKVLTDLSEIFDDEFLPETVDMYVLSKEYDEKRSVLKLYKVIYYVDDAVMDVYKKSALSSEYRENEDCVFQKVDAEASQYWIRVVNGASLKKEVADSAMMKRALMELFEKRVFK